MLGWTSRKSKVFESVKILCEHGKVSVFAEDEEGKTYAYVNTFLTEDTSKTVYSVIHAAENFVYFSDEQKNEIETILKEVAKEFVVWEHKLYE